MLGYKQFRPHEKHVNRVHANDVLLLIVSGTLRFTENGVPIELHAGEYYIQFRQQTQRGEQESDAVYYFVEFLGLRTAQSKNAIPRRGTFDLDRIVPLCQSVRMISNYTQRTMMVYDLFRALSPRRVAQLEIQHTVMALCDYFHQHYTDQLPLEVVARKFNYSTDYLIRFFKNQFGVTPHQYITLLRIAHAKQMIEEGGKTLLATALACGYTDYSAFYRAFTRVTGVTPGEWGKQEI